MKNRTNLKILLDMVLTILFVILIYPRNTGFTFHEIAGLSMAALFGFHIILNWKWVKNVSKNLFSSRLKTRPKLYYLLNAISLISVSVIIFTGVEISQVLFASGTTAINHSYVVVHKWVSYFCLGLFALHIALHWRYIINALGKLAGSLPGPASVKPALSAASIILILGILYSGMVSGQDDETPLVATRKETVVSQSTLPEPSSTISGQADAPERILTDKNGSIAEAATAVEEKNGTAAQDEAALQDNGSSVTEDAPASQDKSGSVTAADSSQPVTLTEFLSKMFCTGCSKHCCLLNPQCNRGAQQAQEAKIEYQQVYGQDAA